MESLITEISSYSNYWTLKVRFLNLDNTVQIVEMGDLDATDELCASLITNDLPPLSRDRQLWSALYEKKRVADSFVYPLTRSPLCVTQHTMRDTETRPVCDEIASKDFHVIHVPVDFSNETNKRRPYLKDSENWTASRRRSHQKTMKDGLAVSITDLRNRVSLVRTLTRSITRFQSKDEFQQGVRLRNSKFVVIESDNFPESVNHPSQLTRPLNHLSRQQDY